MHKHVYRSSGNGKRDRKNILKAFRINLTKSLLKNKTKELLLAFEKKKIMARINFLTFINCVVILFN